MFLEDIVNKHVFPKIVKETEITKASLSSDSLAIKYFGNYRDIPNFGKCIVKNPPISVHRSVSMSKQKRPINQPINPKSISKISEKKKLPLKTTKKILVISHGGWMMELKNLVLAMNGKPIMEKNAAKNTSVYVYKVACANCNSICKNNCIPQKAKIQLVIDNDDSHITAKKYKL